MKGVNDMEIKRERYLQQLISYRFDGLVKVITGIRRCGKSYLLMNIYRDYLIQNGVKDEQIIIIELDLDKDITFRNPLTLSEFVRKKVENSKEEFYLFVDDIPMSDEVPNPYNSDGRKITFYDALNDLSSLSNLDVYVTGSNFKMLSGDVLTEFRGRSDEIRVHPLSFAEYYSAVGGDKNEAFDDYALYGGMPLILSRPNTLAKMNYLNSLFTEVYVKDIVERKKIERQDMLEQILDYLCFSIGSLTDPTKIADTLKFNQTVGVAENTISSYIGYFEDAFLFSESKRYDVKEKSYLDSTKKYYCEDIGLGNSRTGFRHHEMSDIMENIIYNELILRKFSVDAGVVYARSLNQNGDTVRTPREIDFIATSGGKKIYIQSAYSMHTEEKSEMKLRPLALTGDSSQKIVIRKDIGKSWYDDKGVLNINLIDFLLDKELI